MEKVQSLIQADWSEILRSKGIRAKGYGIVPKFAMQDADLTLAEKAVYAYLCSLSGSGFETYPAVSTIKSHLKIGDRAYTSHMKHLVETGYIVREKTRAPGNRFDNNLYHITQQPKKFFLEPPKTPKGELILKTIRADGLLGGGYGQIPRLVMYDSRLDLKSKGLYAYFAAFTGGGEEAFPSREQILRELHISKDTYYRYLDALLNLDYITIHREKNGQFEVNRYILNYKPDISHVSQKRESRKACPKIACTENAGPKYAQPEIAGTKAAGPGIACTEKAGITKITIPTNTVSISTSDKNQIYLPYLPSDPLMAPLANQLLKEIDQIDQMNREELQSELYTWFGVRTEDYGPLVDPQVIKREQALVNFMVDFIQTKRPFVSSGLHVSREEMLARLLQLGNDDIIEVGERVAEFIREGKVRNPKAYGLHALYNQAISGHMDSGF